MTRIDNLRHASNLGLAVEGSGSDPEDVPATSSVTHLSALSRRPRPFPGPSPQPLSADAAELSVAAGGTIALALDGGPAHAGALHLVLGSVTGNVPGIPIDGHVLPLNYDPYLQLTLNGGGLVLGGVGFLDAAGSASAALVAPPGVIPAVLIGSQLHHAWAGLDLLTGLVTITSNAIPTALVP